MARSPRLHVSNGIYYVRLRANSGQVLLRDSGDVAELNQLVANALSLCDARLHAFCWTAAEAHLAVQISEQPVGRLVQLIAGAYARRIHRRLGQSGALFQRHHAVLVASDQHFLKLVRYIHWVPVRLGIVSDPKLHAWSSYHTYLGATRQSWMTTALVRQIHARRGTLTRDAFLRWMQLPLREEDVDEIERAKRCVPARALGPERVATIEAQRVRPVPTPARLDPIIQAVCNVLDVTHAELVSPSRRHRASLARALIAWHAIRNGVGTLKSVADCLSRHPSTLTMAIAHYKKKKTALFATALDDLGAVAGEKEQPMQT